MIGSCSVSTTPPSLARDLLASTDCLIASRLQSSYEALLAPGGVFSNAVTTLLIIYVLVLGYRLMLGLSALTLGEIVPHVLRIGIVVALATNWPTYQQLVINLLFNGPEQIADAVIRQTSGAERLGQGQLLPALQTVFDQMTSYASNAWGQAASMVPAVAEPAPVQPNAGATAVAGAAPAPVAISSFRFQPGAPQFVGAALWLAALLMMASTVGVLLVARIVLAVLLIFGPVFILLGLFDASRGLAEGWLRVTLRFALVPLFTLPLTAVLVAVLIPLVERLADTQAVTFREGPALPIFLIVLVFAVVLFQAMKLAGAISAGLRLPRWAARAPTSATAAGVSTISSTTMVSQPSRSQSLVQSITANTGSARSQSTLGLNSPRLITGSASTSAPPLALENRLGQQYRRLAIGAAPRRQSQVAL